MKKTWGQADLYRACDTGTYLWTAGKNLSFAYPQPYHS